MFVDDEGADVTIDVRVTIIVLPLSTELNVVNSADREAVPDDVVEVWVMVDPPAAEGPSSNASDVSDSEEEIDDDGDSDVDEDDDVVEGAWDERPNDSDVGDSEELVTRSDSEDGLNTKSELVLDGSDVDSSLVKSVKAELVEKLDVEGVLKTSDSDASGEREVWANPPEEIPCKNVVSPLLVLKFVDSALRSTFLSSSCLFEIGRPLGEPLPYTRHNTKYKHSDVDTTVATTLIYICTLGIAGNSVANEWSEVRVAVPEDLSK